MVHVRHSNRSKKWHDFKVAAIEFSVLIFGALMFYGLIMTMAYGPFSH